MFALSLIIRSAVAPVLLLLIPCKTRSLWREKSSKLQNYLQHTALVGGPNPSCCPICQKLCISGEELMEHMKYVHKDPNASGVPGKSRLYCHLLAFQDRGVATISKVVGFFKCGDNSATIHAHWSFEKVTPCIITQRGKVYPLLQDPPPWLLRPCSMIKTNRRQECNTTIFCCNANFSFLF